MQNQIDTLRQLNYELIKNLGLFRQRAGLSFGRISSQGRPYKSVPL